METLYIIFSSSKHYYGGAGRRGDTYDSIEEAAIAAAEEENPAGFDIYVKEMKFGESNWSVPCNPVLTWAGVQKLVQDLRNKEVPVLRSELHALEERIRDLEEKVSRHQIIYH